MPSLNFETGLKTLDINGNPECLISFPPSDAFFISRLYDGFEKIEPYYEDFQKRLKAAEGTKDILKIGLEADAHIRSIIDEVFSDFNEGASETIFGKLSACGIAGGAPLWAGFLVSVINECDEYLVSQKKATNPKLEKLLKKYEQK